MLIVRSPGYLLIISRVPNHILLDFYNSNGLSPFLVAASLNGISAPTNTVASNVPSLASTTGSPTGTSRTSASAGVSTSRLSGADKRVGGSLSIGVLAGFSLGAVGLMGGMLSVVA